MPLTPELLGNMTADYFRRIDRQLIGIERSLDARNAREKGVQYLEDKAKKFVTKSLHPLNKQCSTAALQIKRQKERSGADYRRF